MSKRSKGSYIGGSTVITIRQSDKRMAERQEHWRRKLGRDQIVQLRAVGGDDPPRLIKASEMPPPPPPKSRPTRTIEPPSSGYGVKAVQDRWAHRKEKADAKKARRKRLLTEAR